MLVTEKAEGIFMCLNEDPMPGNDKGPDLLLDKMYQLKQIHTCSCGEKHFDVGLVSSLNYIECYKCREDLPLGNEIHWCHSSRFKEITNESKTIS